MIGSIITNFMPEWNEGIGDDDDDDDVDVEDDEWCERTKIFLFVGLGTKY
jgi:hypothetical protein